MNDISKELEKSILNIFDETDNKIEYNNLSLKLYKPKFSSNNKENLTLFLDDIAITGKRRKSYKVEYRCKCGCINKILLCKFLTKDTLSCINCRETEEKRNWHKLLFKLKKEGIERGNLNKRFIEHNFDKENDLFKSNYFSKNISEEEFNKIKKYIYSIDGNIITDNVSFLPHERCNNSKIYTPKVKIDDKVVSLKNIKLKCPICGKIFNITRPLKERVISHNFKCKDCYLVNNTFKIRKYNDNLTYQSLKELEFIHLCENNSILIEDGIKVDYIFENKKHKYVIDFYLPNLKILVEIKDNHIWHKKQVMSGKWERKIESAKKYANDNGLKYMILFPNDFNTFFKTIKEIV